MPGFLEILVERMALLEKTLLEIHQRQCGCDMPGRADWCIARPRESFRLLSEVDPTKDSFQALEKLLNEAT